jgi:2-polyprenyl-3-methyl-5-hydroxy-6-metoxy-1,4-benzoquinol methylase
LDYLALAERVAETLDIGPGTRVFEVDCGAGAFLFPLYRNGYIVGGTDADAAAVAQATADMPEGWFSVETASALDPATPWDVVICRSLKGAPDPDFIRGLVARMFAKAAHAIALLDVPEPHHQPLLRALAEAGAKAIQIDGLDLFARV